MYAWLRVELSEQQQRVVNAERDEHPCQHVRRKVLVLWLLHHGISRDKAACIAGLGRATVQRYVAAFRDGGLDGLRAWGNQGPVSDLAAHAEAIEAEFTRRPVRTWVGWRRMPVRRSMRSQASAVLRTGRRGPGAEVAARPRRPGPPKKLSTNTSSDRASSSKAS